MCACTSAIALFTTTTFSQAYAGSASVLLSPSALGQRANPSAGTSQSGGAQTGTFADPAIQAQIALSTANLAKAAQAIKDVTAAQAQASASSQLTLNNIPLSGSSWNGTALSGLNPIDDTNPNLWVNADRLQKDAASATATVKQTAANALLYWQSFDLNKGETLNFDQQGHSDWSVLNRVVAGPRDASGSRFVASPTTILGTVKAPGSVYVIDPNGIIFGPTATINVHSLIAASLDVGDPTMTQAQRDNFFLNIGILGNGGTPPIASFSYNQNDSVLEGDVKIDAGATITTSLLPRSVSPDAGGFVYLFAPNVENDGTISTPAGETLMLSAQRVRLLPNIHPDAGIGGGMPLGWTTSVNTIRGVGVYTTNDVGGDFPALGAEPWRTDGPLTAQITSPGTIVNNGLIEADRGVVILDGDNITLGSSANGPGIIRADTSITRNGQVFLDARLKLTLDGGQVQLLPDENGETIPQSAIANFVPAQVDMRALELVDLEPGSLVVAPGASVSLGATGGSISTLYPAALLATLAASFNNTQPRVYLGPDVSIDVSGLDNVALPMASNLLTFKPFGNEFADQPLERNSALVGQSLTVDLRQTGSLNGANWVGTAIADLTGFANAVQRSLDQLLTTGGNVAFSTPVIPTNGPPGQGQVVLRDTSSINVGGGYVAYQGGVAATSKLITADGRIVDIAKANPLDTFVGVAGVFDATHPHWGSTTTEVFVSPVFGGGEFESGYVEGHDAGTIALTATAYALDGSFYAGAIAGERQRAQGLRPSAAAANTVAANPFAMPSAGTLALTGVTNLIIGADPLALDSSFSAGDSLPADTISDTRIGASTLSSADLGGFSATFSGSIVVESGVDAAVVPGGSISLKGGSADIEGGLTAHSGTISIESTATLAGNVGYVPAGPLNPHVFDVTIGNSAVLDASGLWVNDSGASTEQVIGGAFSDSGSVSLKTDARATACSAASCLNDPGLGNGVPAIIDLTGNIVLDQGALLDVSSGGHITNLARLQLDSSGRIAGKGGNVTLETYVGLNNTFDPGNTANIPTLQPLESTIVLPGTDGTGEQNANALNERVSAFGFAQGGTLTIQAPSIQVGGAPSAAPGVLDLSADFFAGNAFGKYSLLATAGSVVFAPNITVTLRQRNFTPESELLTLVTGSKPSVIDSVDFLPDVLRSPVDLNLGASLPTLPSAPYDPKVVTPPSAIALLIGQGDVVQGDPGANFSVTGIAGRKPHPCSQPGCFTPEIAQQIAVAEILGDIIAPGGTISFSNGSSNGSAFSEFWLGAQSRLDASGRFVPDARQPAFRTGTIYQGGSVSFSASAPLVALQGSVIDVSGASGTLDLLANDVASPLPGEPQRVATPIWSDAGSISLAGTTLLFDGSFFANAGASEGNGGTLTIVQSGLTVLQGGNVVPAGLQPGDSLGALQGKVLVQADRISGSGIANVDLSAGGLGDSAGTSFTPGTIAFSGNVTLRGLNSLFVDASEIALTNVVAATDVTGCNVCLRANYVALRGAGSITPAAIKGSGGNLRIEASTIDIAAGGSLASTKTLALSNVSSANFVSSGDIRLRIPLATAPPDLGLPGVSANGELITAGDLTFEAVQIYPVSAVDFTLKSLSPTGTIRFVQDGAPQAAPLSAGGSIAVSAADIVQDGTVLAPLGTIRLGAQVVSDLSPSDPTQTLVPTASVTFGAGSITSVSLDGQVVPYGETANGSSWSYDSQGGIPLTVPPAKELIVTGAAVSVGAGATIDLRGGGDIQAEEFVPGTGGTRDVLAGNANVYAIVPGYNPAAPPIDLDFVSQKGDALPAPGRSVFLSGIAGLPAGYYTLLPPHYATLPGAYRVSLEASSLDALSSNNKVLPDGTLRVAGFFAEPSAGTRDARTQFFDVQPSSVWRQYSEIDQTSGNAFFGATTVGSSGLRPRLPIDAARAVFAASPLAGVASALDLSGTFLATPGATSSRQGRGAQIDIAAPDIEVLAPGGAAKNGYLGLDATQLSGLGVDSLMLGGIRSDTSAGESVSVVANSVDIGNNAAAPLRAPELILVARSVAGAGDPNQKFGIQLDAGSVVEAAGTPSDTSQHTFTIGDAASAISGEGELLAVSNGLPLVVLREDAGGTNGVLSVLGPDAKTGAPAAILTGSSLTLDTTGAINLNSGVTVGGSDISIAARDIVLGSIPKKGAPVGLHLSADVLAQLEQAKTLALRAVSGAIDFFGDASVVLAKAGSRLVLDASSFVAHNGGHVTLDAAEIDLTNTSGKTAKAAADGGTFQFNATDIALGGGTTTLSGIANASFAGSNVIATSTTGAIQGGAADLTFETPLFLVGTGANETISTTGAVTFASLGPSGESAPGQIGGTLAVNGASITLSNAALIQATAGGVTLDATAGGITLDAGAQILANGYVQAFFDTERVAGGGDVRLIAENGNIDIDPAAGIDVSSAIGQLGNAGSVTLSAANGSILSAGHAVDFGIIAGSLAGDSGGRLAIVANTLGTTTLAIPSLFSDTVDVHLNQGDLSLATDLVATNVTLTADRGVITIDHAIDASGVKGGTISLFGGAGVNLVAGGELLATASDATKRGGDVVIGTEIAADNGTGADGVIDLAAGLIDVSNTANAANGGTVHLRAPLFGKKNAEGFIDSATSDVAIDTVSTTITGASSVAVEAFEVFDTKSSAFNGIIDPVTQANFYGSCDAKGACSGTLVDFVQHFAGQGSALLGHLQAKFASIPTTILHFQPGMELVNDHPAVNSGDIEVAAAWNLGSGIAGSLVNATAFTDKNGNPVPVGTAITDAFGKLEPQYANYKGQLDFLDGTSAITELFYRTNNGSPTGEAGVLTLRAERNVDVDASLTDGFFQTRNVFDTKYINALSNWLQTVYFQGGAPPPTPTTDVSNVGGYIIAGASFTSSLTGAAPPVAPYSAQGNVISPKITASDRAPITGADLFPLIADANGPISGTGGTNYRAIESSSYRIVGGAEVTSANPLGLRPLADFVDGADKSLIGQGNVTIDGHTAYSVPDPLSAIAGGAASDSYRTPTIIRTGTGAIDIAAGRDFILADHQAPGVVYTAGRSSVDLRDPGFVQTPGVADPLNPGQTLTVPVATNPSGFLKPLPLYCATFEGCNLYGPLDQAAYPVEGGHLTLVAQQDILGFEHPTVSSAGSTFADQQYFAPWLLAQGTELSVTSFGPFSPLSAYLSSRGTLFTPSQTSWWINFGSFDQGLMSVGGDVRVVAGRDIQELSVSLPTTVRVSGGLSNTTLDAHGNTIANVPVVDFNGSGDLVVIAGRDLKSGAYYEGSGSGKIVVGGSISASWSDATNGQPADPISTVLAVDTGKIALVARRNIDIAGIVSPPSLQNIADTSATTLAVLSQSMSGYGPSSASTITSISGEVIDNSIQRSSDLVDSEVFQNVVGGTAGDAYPGVHRAPANLEIVALRGDVEIADALQLATSDQGTLSLFAFGSLSASNANGDARPISTGPSLVERVFDAVQPLAGFAPAFGSQVFDVGAHLLHQGDAVLDKLYALTGSIVAGAGPDATINSDVPLAFEIDKPARIQAGLDIIDLSLFGQNLSPTDVTSVVAGRDIAYSGAWQALIKEELGGTSTAIPIPELASPENWGGLSLAGPGFFDVEAGRNLGPFVTASGDIAANPSPPLGFNDPTGTGIITFGNTVVVGNRRIASDASPDLNNSGLSPATPDQFALGSNQLLPRQGADINVLFGDGKGVDYQAVIAKYIDPATATSTRNYLPLLVEYLQTLGYPAMSTGDAWKTFQALDTQLKDIFVDKVFVSELRVPGEATGCCFKQYDIGYSIINTLFPAALGYTDDSVANPVKIPTGNIDMLHATIKTLQSGTDTVAETDGTTSSVAVGGDVTVLGPGGNVNVGTTAVESNSRLPNSALGILTLDDGAINTFTDGSVLVDQSRILTVQGGDVVMWSSNGDLDAGRGARTTVDFKPLTVNFAPNDLQTINLNGLVSGAGIGTIRSTPDAPSASAVLIAPHGTVNAGAAGLRSTGSISIAALQILNAANIQFSTSETLSTATSFNLQGALSASAQGGQAAQAAEQAVGATTGRAQAQKVPSLFSVEILGFGNCDPESGRKCPEQ